MNNMIIENLHIDTIKQVLVEEAEAILDLAGKLNQEISIIVEKILRCPGRVIITGVGKSGLIGKKITATLASTGTPSLFLHPSEGLHGDLGMVTSSDIVIALSNSGESEEILNIIPSIKRIGAELIAFVGNESSTLAKRANYILSIGKIKEACPLGLTPTTSTTVMLSLGDAMAIALLKARNFSSENFAVFHPGGSIGKRLLLTVQYITDITKKNPVVLSTSTIRDAIFNMTESGLGAASVSTQEGILIGIITDGDIRRALTKNGTVMDLLVKDLYNMNPKTIKPTSLAVEALNIMEDLKVNVLPVVNEINEPIAMIHLHDITRMGF